MPIEQAPFRKYHLKESRDTFTVAINKEERVILEKLKDVLHEDKDSTSIKQAALYVSTIVLFDDKTRLLLDLAVANYRRALRTGRLRQGDI